MATKKIVDVSWYGETNRHGVPRISHAIAKFSDNTYGEWWAGHKRGVPKYVAQEIMKSPKAQNFFGKDYIKYEYKK